MIICRIELLRPFLCSVGACPMRILILFSAVCLGVPIFAQSGAQQPIIGGAGYSYSILVSVAPGQLINTVCGCCQHAIDRACPSFWQFASYDVGRCFRDLPAGLRSTGSHLGSAANLHMPGNSTATRKRMCHDLSRHRSNALQHADGLPSLRQA